MFIQSSARCNLLCDPKRIDVNSWNTIIDQLVSTEYLSKIKIAKNYAYRINLRNGLNNKVLSHSYMIKKIRDALKKNHSSEITASKLHKSFASAYRPKIADLEHYLNDLVLDNEVSVREIQGIKYYQLIN